MGSRKKDYSLPSRLARTCGALLLVLLVTVLISSDFGAVDIPPGSVAKALVNHIPGLHGTFDVPDGEILWDFRIPRVLLGALVGMALATAGAALQGLLLNPLADPYMIGVSSGAAVGAGIAVILGLAGLFLPLFAFASALIAVAIVYMLARKGDNVSILSFILAGVAVGAFMWAVLTFILTIAPDQALDRIVFWTMGSLAASDPWPRCALLAPFVLLGFAAVYAFARDLNIFALGEESAMYLGLRVESLKRVIVVLATLITAAAVSVSGTIGFIGLMVPHIARRIVGPDNRILLPAAALLGAVFMITADALARTLKAPTEIPVGIITALLGAPFFLYLLKKTG